MILFKKDARLFSHELLLKKRTHKTADPLSLFFYLVWLHLHSLKDIELTLNLAI